MNLTTKVKRIGHHDLPLPAYKTSGAACFDLCVAETKSDEILENQTISYGTGFAFQIPEGHVMLLYIRSSIGCKKHVTLTNNVGVIDADYRGEVTFGLHFPKWQNWRPEIGERVCQAMVIPVDQVPLVEVSELDETERGKGGHGSTGTH